ncbi:MAG: GNAT family protein [Acidimicrobiia bacterium]
MIPERITTDRLILRRFTRRDTDSVFLAVESSLPQLSEYLPWAHAGYAKEDAAAYIRDSISSWKEGRAFDFAIRLRSHPAHHLGNISIWHVSRLGRTGEIGYWVRTDHANRGIATEATAALLDNGFMHMGLHKITLRIAEGNRSSERVAQKLGFTREGVLREELRINGMWIDHTLYSILEHEHGLRPLAK